MKRFVVVTAGIVAVVLLLAGLWAWIQASRAEATEAHLERSLQGLTDPDERIRWDSAKQLGFFRHWTQRELDPRIVPALTRTLARDSAFNVRSEAAWALGALGALGPGAEEAIPALEEAMKDPEERVRSTAAEALLRIKPKTQDPSR